MNQTLVETLVQELRLPSGPARTIVLVTMVSEGALLIVAAQAGFIDGPRVLSNMAHDSWVPHRFASLSERLTTHNGVLLMGGSAIAALWATRGDVATLVLMYSINVFVTFSLSMVAMLWHWWRQPRGVAYRRRRLALFGIGAALCTTILVITVAEKFLEGGWITIAVTGACVGVCLVTRRYYQQVTNSLRRLDDQLLDVAVPPAGALPVPPLDREAPTAVVLVGGYGGLGVHTFFKVQQFIPRHFRNFVFVSVGVVDSSNFKGEEAVDEIKERTAKSLEQYVALANRAGLSAVSYMALGTDVVEELEQLCLAVARDYPRCTAFAGQLVFQRDSWYQHLLHNQTAFAVQRRLQWGNVPMVILPTRVK